MCDGSGHRQCSRTETCKTCWGGGVSDNRPVVKNENRDCEYCGSNHKEEVRCGECYGNGYVNYECSRCDGNGQITVR
jgi:RecJ-like exonuclease